ncbi:MAG TPA: D-hexose-6-phosphate mutarotase [Dermatophilaceae bacterium]|nr:D-hexose-6-phosphate mutarotase [Dermatophilaceae bacterium]
MSDIREIGNAAATGRVSAHGATVLSWRPTGHEEVLFVSPRAVLDGTAAIRGGIPVCWPWFGAGPGGDRSPRHGLARTARWALEKQVDGERETALTYLLTAHCDPRFGQLYPYLFETRLTAVFGERLRVSLQVSNTGAEPLVFEAALHTYLRVGDVRTVRVGGLGGAAYLDMVGAPTQRVQESDELVIAGETDRIYESSRTVTVTDPVLRRRLVVETTGAAQRVVWNPGEQTAHTLADLGDAWPGFLCVESANVRGHTVVIEPGQSGSMGYLLAVHELDDAVEG